MKKMRLTEGMVDDISSALRYVIFIDIHPISTKKGGLVTIMFPNIDHRSLVKWLNGADRSDLYIENEESLKKIYSNMSISSSLKDLYRTVSKLKSQETSEESNDERKSNIEMVMRKIEKTIKAKLSNEELELFNEMKTILSPAANIAAKSIEDSVSDSTIESEPESEPEIEDTPEPTPEEKEEFEEALRMESYLKSVIREIVEKRLNLK